MIPALIAILAVLILLAAVNLIFGRLPKMPPGGGGVAQTAHGGLHYLETIGEGPPIVFIHGMPGTCREFDEMRELLSDRHTIAFDRPGYAWSPGAPQPFEQQLDAIVEAAATLGIEQAVVVGHSFGGLATLGLAIRHPGFVSRMLLIAPAAGGIRLTDATIKQARLIEFIERPVIRQLADLFFLRLLRKVAATRGAAVSYGSADMLETKRLVAVSVLARHNSIRALANDRLLFNDAERWVSKNIAQITAPSLILQGESDPTVTPRHAVRIAEALPGSRLEVIAGDHQLPSKNADQAVSALNRLLAE